MSFCVNEFEVGVNVIFSGNEQQKVYLLNIWHFLNYNIP